MTAKVARFGRDSRAEAHPLDAERELPGHGSARGAVSYWDCYHRHRYPQLRDSPALKTLHLLSR